MGKQISSAWTYHQQIAVKRRLGIQQAAQRGEYAPGLKALMHAMGAIGAALEQQTITDPDRVSLHHLHQCLHEHLIDCVPIARALCVEIEQKKRGRPRKPQLVIADALICLEMKRELDAASARGEKPRVKDALSRVAGTRRVSNETIKKIWQRAGGLRGAAKRKQSQAVK